MKPNDADLLESSAVFGNVATPDEVENDGTAREWAAGARCSYWVGVVLLGTFLTSLINAVPPRLADTAWQLNLISLLLASGAITLIGALLVCLARTFDQSDRQLLNRAQLVRKLAPWVATGWLLLIPVQLFLGVRLINNQASTERAQLQILERSARDVRNANSEMDLRSALAQLPNEPPPPRLTVPLEVAKANVLAQFQKTINAAKNNLDQRNTARWENWVKEAFRNTLQGLLLTLGFLALGKNRLRRDPIVSRSRRKRK